MTVDNVREFSQIVENNTDIQKRLEATTASKNLIDIITSLGSENGFIFTPEDVIEYYTEVKSKAQIRTRGISRERSGLPSSLPGAGPCSGLSYLAYQICLKELNQ
jgi:hypothetical protein